MYHATTLSGMRDSTRTAFGERLVKARKRKGLTQTQLAKLVGMGQSTLTEAEKSGQGSSFTAQIAAACDVDELWLATGEGDMLRRPAGLEGAQPVRPGKINSVAVVGRGNGGVMPERIWTDEDYPAGATGEVAEIASTDPQAFVIEVEGTSMAPKYMPRAFALVEPGTDIDLEDDVLVRLVSGETLLKRLVSRRAGYSLASYGDAIVHFFKPEEVLWIYYVAYPVPRKKIKSRT